MNQKKPSLVIFCKRPKLNQGKQRLAEDSSAQSALTIAKALLDCALEDARNWQGPVVLACSNNDDMEWAKSLNLNALIIAQLPLNKAGNLGDRLNFIDNELRKLGHQQLVFIGTDAPILNEQHYSEIEHALKSNDIALSQADDGGVVIMANKTPWPNLTHLPWSTDKLSLSLSQLCKESHLTVSYTMAGYDIDYMADIKKLLIDLQSDTRPARQALLATIKQTINDLTLLPKATTHA